MRYKNFHVLLNEENGDSVLHAAVSSQNPTLITLILENFPFLMTKVNSDGCNCLHWAAQCGSVEALQALLEFEFEDTLLKEIDTVGAPPYKFVVDVNEVDSQCRTALYLAVAKNHLQAIQYMLQFQCDFIDGTKRCPFQLDVYCNRGRTPLMVAAFNQSMPLITELLDKGADINLPLAVLDTEQSIEEGRCVGSGALVEATRAGALQIVQYLLSRGAQDTDNKALILAADLNYDKIIRIFLMRLVFPDNEYKINKKNIDLGQVQLGQNLLPSSLCPSKAAMIHWSAANLSAIEYEWFVGAALITNPRLRTTRLCLAALTRIDISSNNLKIFPSPLFQMPSLKSLNLAENKIANINLPSFYISTTCLEILNLKGNQLREISPQFLASFPQLQNLDISKNSINHLPEYIWLCPALKDLNVAFNQLSTLPMASSPRHARLSRHTVNAPETPNQTSAQNGHTNESQANLPNVSPRPLNRLNVWQTTINLSKVDNDDFQPDFPVTSSSTLTMLNVSHNKFQVFPACLACTCPRLVTLNFSHNQLTTLPPIACYPAHLRNFDASHNQIKDCFPTEITQLHTVCHAVPPSSNTSAMIRRNSPQRHNRSRSKSAVRSQRSLSVSRHRNEATPQLDEACVHRRHDRLEWLSTLTLTSNRVTNLTISYSAIRAMFPSLTVLDISDNLISNLPKELSLFSNLSVLNLSGNKGIKELPPELGMLSRLWSLSLQGCKLKEPLNSMVNADNCKTVEVIAHLKTILEESKKYHHLRLMILGGNGAGKTTLWEAMRSEAVQKRQSNQANSVQVCEWKYDAKKSKNESLSGPIGFSAWDFKGHRERLLTHQYFLIKRSLFLVVWKVVDGDAAANDIQYWLVSIQCRIPNACVILVGTHTDQISSNSSKFPQNYAEEVNEKMKQRFMLPDPDKKGLPRVIDAVLISNKNKSHIKALLGVVYKAAWEVRDDIELHAACKFLHDAGEIVRFEDAALRDLIFVDSVWLSDSLYSVMSLKSPTLPQGLLQGDALVPLQKAMRLSQGQLVDLLHKFELALLCAPRVFLLFSLLPDEYQLRADYPTPAVKLSAKSTSWAVRVPEDKKVTSLNYRSGLEELTNKPLSPKRKLTRQTQSEDVMLSFSYKKETPLRRIYTLAYVPTGFWSRLITRLTGDLCIIKAIDSLFATKSSEEANDIENLIENRVPAEWMIWQSGIEMLLKGHSIFVLKQFLPQAEVREIDYSQAEILARDEQKRWRPHHFVETPIIEILLFPFKISAASGEKKLSMETDTAGLSRLLAATVDLLDTLLEDWYPALGTRFAHSSEGELLVRRLVPCTGCLQEQLDSRRTSHDDAELKQEHQNNAVGVRSSKTLGNIKTANSLYCFSIEECMLAGREYGWLECPNHGGLHMRTIAPDTIFCDIDPSLIVGQDNIKKARMLGRGAFGFVFRAHVRLANGELVEAAQKMFEPVDPGPNSRASAIAAYKAAADKWRREPQEFACRAYCTSRQELNLLSRMKHANVTSLIVMCSSPLSLIVELAPLGALNQLLSAHRKSGVRLSLPVLKESAVQVARALEYLHSNHIIYRDLKSENVLAWRFPAPFCNQTEVLLKLGDYGISRSILPSGGAKGYGGTEGFMAPEIVRFNGEEEYTQKVDCFSFGMFLYELITLKQPFEKEEHVKERLLDGARPVLLPHELLVPSPTLDLLVHCWSAHPDVRPSSSQLVGYCSAPEFIHLLDVCLLEDTLPPSSLLVASSEDSAFDDADEFEAQIWICTNQLSIMDCTEFGWLDHRVANTNIRAKYTLKHHEYVFACDEAGQVQVLTTSLFEVAKLRFPQLNGLLINAPLSLGDDVLLLTTIKQLVIVKITEGLSVVNLATYNSPFDVHSSIFVNPQNNRQIWAGHSDGRISVHHLSAQSTFSFCSSLYIQNETKSVKRMISSSDGSTVWINFEKDNRVLRWDVERRQIGAALDVRKVMPSSETIKTLDVDAVTGDAVVSAICLQERATDSQIYIATTRGLLIVANAQQLQPICACRPYDSEIVSLTIVKDRKDEEKDGIHKNRSSLSGTSSESGLGWVRERVSETVERFRPSPSAIEEDDRTMLVTRDDSIFPVTNSNPETKVAKMRIAFGCLEPPLVKFFHSYGKFVARHPVPFIVFPLLLTCYLSTGFFHLVPLTDAIYLYTPTDAPSKTERQIIHELWPLTDGSYVPGRSVTQSREAQVAVVAKNDGNILLTEYARAIKRLDLYIRNRIKVVYRNHTYTYKDICLRWRDKGCPTNDHVGILSELYNHGINITYPTFRFGDRSGYLGSALGGVTLAKGYDKSVILAGAKAWLMVYQLQFYPNNISYISGLWEREFKRHVLNYGSDPYISITIFHSQTLAEELKKNADNLAPRFISAFIILIIFAVFCSMVTIKGTLYIDWVLSKPILSVLGVMNAGMAIASAIGFLVLIGIPYNDIVAVMPFLVVAVGTDNMFLMVAAVKRTSRLKSVEDRISECMSDAAVSILITALTDAFSFAVGCITTIPAVQVFCIYTCCALVMTFVYQITFFCGLLSLATQWEAQCRHCVLFCSTLPPKLPSSSSICTRFLWMGSRPHADSPNKHCTATAFFQNWYAPLLMQPVIKFLAGVWYLIYVGFAVYGCMQLKEGLEPANLLVDDSYATPHYRVLEKHFWHYGAQLQIVVNNPPDLRNPGQRSAIHSVVKAFANSRLSIGEEGVQFWLFEMERFLVGMRDISTTIKQTEATNGFREIASRYPQYNITTFMPLWLFTDQYTLVVPNTVQDIVIAVSCMLLIAFLLIPQPFCALWVAFTIGSIDLGVLGYMTLWGVNLDAISMITIIMSVGFSVDYSAHITYGYVVSKERDSKMRVRDALGDLGWPVVQGATSTILAVIVLADVPAYMIVTFFKTVFLAISIGLIHGLIFLPLMLSIFVRGKTLNKKKLKVHCFKAAASSV
ncbi:hypothetical protein WR25_21242 [Diploscapter pachys]|uniref:non-specific serine/threonine protein kinase n=1 Tax=Diploscapter pachys TaxID=2018661 RepID=A0A2A2JD31_9BILA|nr:hypothetical protein WR25_21242 [Diploscapter pachys]